MSPLIWIALGLFARWLVDLATPSTRPGRAPAQPVLSDARRQMKWEWRSQTE
jgi:hypothetical protein